jgi:DEAD/DEAH box helicase domain-containing protein
MAKDSQINSFFEKWIYSEDISENITHIQTKNNFYGDLREIPAFINSELKITLQEIGINSLYSHQLQAIKLIFDGKNTVLTTGPSSGKSLAYTLPILNALYQNENSNALLLFPTKALAYDQLTHFKEYIDNSQNNNLWKKDVLKKISVYDGDTPKEIRSSIRKHAQVILTNPDMLHVGILPNHFLWEKFFENLKFIILDESHIYHGIFGSHVANVIRRLKRILSLYNQKPVYVCTSATIGNPIEFLSKLVEDEFVLVSEDGSPQGRKQVVFYNPPLLNEDLGIRKSSHQEALKIVSELLENGVQSLVFQGTRKEVEKSLKKIKEQDTNKKDYFSAAYRSGYLANDRRKLEEDFRSGKINVLFSTNALELGVDIGGLKCVILSGYPGSISSTLQQIGRAGRKQSESLAILIASMNPIDQYIIKRPEYLFINSPEKAIINPNNPNILLEHLKISLYELSFVEGEKFGNLSWDQTRALLDLLIENGYARKNNNKYLIVDSSKFLNDISLRNLGGNTLKLVDITNDKHRIFGEIDYSSSLWMVHPNAIYLHLGVQYIVENMNFETNEVLLAESNVDYFTEPKIDKTIALIEQTRSKSLNNLDLFFGKIKVTQTVIGYKEILWESHQKISEDVLELPEIVLDTEAFWFYIPDSIKNELINEKFVFNYKNEYGPEWNKYKDLIRKRDNCTCQNCGIQENDTAHHIHHKKPIKLFESIEEANHPSNLVTLCAKCHRLAEIQVKVKSGMNGLSYLLKTLSPIFILCGPEDIDVILDSKNEITGFENSILMYDNISYGLGLSLELYNNFHMILPEMLKHIKDCGCHHGCPSCVGPVSDEGYGGKEETIRLLELIMDSINGYRI